MTSNYYIIKCCFFQFFNSPVALKNEKKMLAPQEKVEMTPLEQTRYFAPQIVQSDRRGVPKIQRDQRTGKRQV